MNTKDLSKVKTLVQINPEVEESVNLILSDVQSRLNNSIQDYNESDRGSYSRQYLEGRKDAYWNIQDLLIKIINP